MVLKWVNEPIIKNCLTCGSEFEAKSHRHKYCCLECRPSYNPYATRAPKEGYDLTCVVCGKPFKSMNKTSRYCSNNCLGISIQKKRLPEYDNVKICPVWEPCFEISQINCENRDFRTCDLFRNLVKDKRNRERKRA